jgi:hypothetical protein
MRRSTQILGYFICIIHRFNEIIFFFLQIDSSSKIFRKNIFNNYMTTKILHFITFDKIN